MYENWALRRDSSFSGVRISLGACGKWGLLWRVTWKNWAVRSIIQSFVEVSWGRGEGLAAKSTS